MPTPKKRLPLINAQKPQDPALFLAALDDLTENAYAQKPRESTLHDRLFEALMTRFDVMEPYRERLHIIIEQGRRDTALALPLAKAHWRSMQKTLTFVCKTEPSWMAISALFPVYLLSLYDWSEEKDDSHATVMARLDQRLSLLEKGGLLL
ncbi:MAG: hypothetical protein WC612_06095 [Bdellovibrionales bacterium]